MKIKSGLVLSGIMCLVFSLVGPTLMLAQITDQKLKLKQGALELMTFQTTADGWKVKSLALVLKAKKKDRDYRFKISESSWDVKIKDDKYRIINADNSLRFKVKYSPDKIKVYRTEDDPQPWSIKLKDDKLRFKVKKGELELGQIKFYPEKSKLKVKDKNNVETCSMHVDRLIPSPAVCLFEGLSEEDRMLLFALLSIIAI
ncbi:hypothetical protein ACFL27_07485 [candidate division CSSED10-310 bacterium]|uniref:Uncharacterized protein n=1 Tax=candidate division CSSED10-310 bacterium TaxID=2855610 RepID=A0ABV6YUZ7_UNCC1